MGNINQMHANKEETEYLHPFAACTGELHSSAVKWTPEVPWGNKTSNRVDLC